jgi:LPS-assembly protein
MRLGLDRDSFGVSSSYVHLLADESESRDEDVSELSLEGRYQITPNWEANFDTRYDFVADRAASAGLKLAFRNECIKLDMALSRRFTSSTSVNPTTSFGLSVDLLGFGGKSKSGPAAACRG